MRTTRLLPLPLALVAVLAGCAGTREDLPPVALVAHVDLPRYMGEWYVIASIPTFLDKGAHNARESYWLDPDGTVPTVFTFNAGARDGAPRKYESRAFILDKSNNAVWGEQYVWPIKADYRISYLSPDYTQTVVMREKRDNVWIMARTPTIPEADLARLIDFVGSQGYDIAKLQRVPQDAVR